MKNEKNYCWCGVLVLSLSACGSGGGDISSAVSNFVIVGCTSQTHEGIQKLFIKT